MHLCSEGALASMRLDKEAWTELADTLTAEELALPSKRRKLPGYYQPLTLRIGDNQKPLLQQCLTAVHRYCDFHILHRL